MAEDIYFDNSATTPVDPLEDEVNRFLEVLVRAVGSLRAYAGVNYGN